MAAHWRVWIEELENPARLSWDETIDRFDIKNENDIREAKLRAMRLIRIIERRGAQPDNIEIQYCNGGHISRVFYRRKNADQKPGRSLWGPWMRDHRGLSFVP